MKKSIVFVLAIFLIAISFPFIPQCMALSEEWQYDYDFSWDSNQNNMAEFTDLTIYAMSDELMGYDDEGELTFEFTSFDALYASAGTPMDSYGARMIKILRINSTSVMVARARAEYSTGAVGYDDLYLCYELSVVNVYNSNYEVLNSSYRYLHNPDEFPLSDNVDLSGYFFTNQNSTGLYPYCDIVINHYSNSSSEYGWYRHCAGFGYVVDGTDELSFTAEEVIYTGGTCYYESDLMSNIVAFNVTNSLWYVLCAETTDVDSTTNKGTVIEWDFDSGVPVETVIGSTSVSGSYGSRWNETVSDVKSEGFVYLMGWHNETTPYEYYFANIAFAYEDNLRVGTVYWNDSVVQFSGSLSWGLNIDGLCAYPYTVVVPSGSTGGTSGTYSIAVWTDVVTDGALTGYDFELEDIEESAPSWGYDSENFGYLWTPSAPHTHSYEGYGYDVGGYQKQGEPVGIMIDYTNNRAKVDEFEAIGAEWDMVYFLSGDIFVNAQPSEAPTIVSLRQTTDVLYVIEGIMYEGTEIYTGDGGNYTVSGTTYGATIDIYESSYSEIYTGNLSSGSFDFYVPASGMMSTPMFRGISIEVDLNETYSETTYYLFGFYGAGQEDYLGNTPYEGTGETDDTGVLDNFVDFIVYFVILGMPPMLLSLGGAKVGWGLQGLLFGLFMSMSIGVIIGIIPFWFVTIAVMFMVVFLYSLVKR